MKIEAYKNMKKLVLLLVIFLYVSQYFSQNICFSNPPYSPVNGWATYINHCGIADFNNDNRPDFAVPTNGASYFYLTLSSGSNTYLASNSITTTTNFNILFTGDFNNDSNQDVGLVGYDSSHILIMNGNGVGSFTSSAKYNVGLNPLKAIKVDFNNDGFLDIATVNITANNISVLINNTTGGFHPSVNYTTNTQPYNINSSDLNNDGAPDLYISCYSNPIILENIGNGTFQFGSYPPFNASVSFDLNNDGLNDLFGIASNTLNISINQGNFVFGTPTTTNCGFPFPIDFDVIDANSDGKNDLIFLEYSAQGKYSILINNGSGVLLSPLVYTVSTFLPRGIQTANIDNNGKDDFVIQCDNDPNIYIQVNCLTSNINQNSYEKGDVFVYPTISNGTYNLNELINQFKVFDMNGKLIIKGNGKTINLNAYPNGIYFLHAEIDNGQTGNFKLIKTN